MPRTPRTGSGIVVRRRIGRGRGTFRPTTTAGWQLMVVRPLVRGRGPRGRAGAVRGCWCGAVVEDGLGCLSAGRVGQPLPGMKQEAGRPPPPSISHQRGTQPPRGSPTAACSTARAKIQRTRETARPLCMGRTRATAPPSSRRSCPAASRDHGATAIQHQTPGSPTLRCGRDARTFDRKREPQQLPRQIPTPTTAPTRRDDGRWMDCGERERGRLSRYSIFGLPCPAARTGEKTKNVPEQESRSAREQKELPLLRDRRGALQHGFGQLSWTERKGLCRCRCRCGRWMGMCIDDEPPTAQKSRGGVIHIFGRRKNES